jgi:hypothetical protein
VMQLRISADPFAEIDVEDSDEKGRASARP